MKKLALWILVLGMVLTACGSGRDREEAATGGKPGSVDAQGTPFEPASNDGPTPTRAPLETAAPEGTGTAETGGGTGASTEAQTVPVDLKEFEIDPKDLKAKAGKVSFKVKNTGSVPHAFALQGEGITKSSQTIDGGGATTLEVDLKPGTYKTWCPVDGHEQAGMVGALEVTEGGAAAESTQAPSAEATSAPTGAPEAEATAQPTAQAQPTATEGASRPAGAQIVSVGLKDLEIVPKNLTAKAGKVTFEIKNTGAITHAFALEGPGIKKESAEIEGSQSTKLTVDLKPGKYKTWCPVDGHEQAGMVGTLAVK